MRRELWETGWCNSDSPLPPSWGLNPGPRVCWTSARPLSYVPQLCYLGANAHPESCRMEMNFPSSFKLIWKVVTCKHFRLARKGGRAEGEGEKGGRRSDFYKNTRTPRTTEVMAKRQLDRNGHRGISTTVFSILPQSTATRTLRGRNLLSPV